MALLNVRLDAEDERRAKALKRAGVQLSRIVREAIRAEHERCLGAGAVRGAAREVMARIYAAHPDPPKLRPRRYAIDDRRASRRAILRKLRKGRR
jgi:hypothetical protein